MKKFIPLIILSFFMGSCFVEERDGFSSVSFNISFNGNFKTDVADENDLIATVWIDAEDLPSPVSDTWTGNTEDKEITLDVSLTSGRKRTVTVLLFTRDGELKGWGFYRDNVDLLERDMIIDVTLQPLDMFGADFSFEGETGGIDSVKIIDAYTGIVFEEKLFSSQLNFSSLPCGRFIYLVMVRNGIEDILYDDVIYSHSSTDMMKTITLN
ncbi:MAG: hypothetical protein JXR95_11315 [Deltaproteobacteria bacterium]|nr:hypothetical protein [Deltaproteobacteria bacterium]